MPQPSPNASKDELARYGRMCAERAQQEAADHHTRQIVISVLHELGLIDKPPPDVDTPRG